VAPNPRKARITIRLDADVIEHFKRLVHDAGGGTYHTLINEGLREYMNNDEKRSGAAVGKDHS
jgi:uncharacterized protein (DUF4415 family)